MTTEQMQLKVDAAGFTHVKVVDANTVEISVDDEPTIVSRSDTYGGHPLSGWATYGWIGGDHRMIRAIYEDMQTVFELLKTD